MIVATPTSVISNPDTTEREIIVDYALVLTANYGGANTHGDTVDLSADVVKSSAVPNRVEVIEAPPAGTAPTGYQLGYAPGTTQKNGVLTIMNGAATEYTEGSAYSAPLLAAVITLRAWFPAFN